jgi:hypothetical protein
MQTAQVEKKERSAMSGNYAGIGNYADAEDDATNDELEAADETDERLAGVIVHD